MVNFFVRTASISIVALSILFLLVDDPETITLKSIRQTESKQVNYVAELLDGKPFLSNRTRPAFNSLCKHNQTRPCELNPTATAQSKIIDYAVLGFAKAGSTTVGSALGRIGQAPRGDTCASVTSAILQSYKGWPKQYGPVPKRKNQEILTGLKCPAGLEMPSIIDTWSEYQPETLLIAGIRHPVLAFQSFYNMFIQNGWDFKDPHDVLPSCQSKETCSERGCPGNGILCVDRVRYHVALAKLGKTPLDDEEQQLLPFNNAETPLSTRRAPNNLFLYEVTQLTDTNEGRDEIFWTDLSNALDLPFTIHPSNITNVKPGRKDLSEEVQAKRNQRKMNVCDAQNDDLRAILMEFAIQTADWICPYLLQEGTGVIVSSKEHFCGTIMESWRKDPCVDQVEKR